MNEPEPPAPGSPPTPDPRLRPMKRLVVICASAGLLLAVAAGAAGASGRAGMAVFLLVTTLGCGMSAVYGMVTAVIDEFRDRPISRQRVVGMVGAFFGAAALMAMVAGIGG